MTNISCLFCGSDKLVKLACPMCSLVFSSYSTLQEHVELHLREELQVDGTVYTPIKEHAASSGFCAGGCTLASVSSTSVFLHFGFFQHVSQRSATSVFLSYMWHWGWFPICVPGEKSLECPMCSLVCTDSFSLQEHVELHFDHDAAMSSSGTLTLVRSVKPILVKLKSQVKISNNVFLRSEKPLLENYHHNITAVAFFDVHTGRCKVTYNCKVEGKLLYMPCWNSPQLSRATNTKFVNRAHPCALQSWVNKHQTGRG